MYVCRNMFFFVFWDGKEQKNISAVFLKEPLELVCGEVYNHDDFLLEQIIPNVCMESNM